MSKIQTCPACDFVKEDHRVPNDITSGDFATICVSSSSKVRAPRLFVETVWSSRKNGTNEGYYHFALRAFQSPFPYIELTPVIDPRAPITKNGVSEQAGNYTIMTKKVSDVGPDASDSLTVLTTVKKNKKKVTGDAGYPRKVYWWIKDARSGRGLSIGLRRDVTTKEWIEITKVWTSEDWACAQATKMIPLARLQWLYDLSNAPRHG